MYNWFHNDCVGIHSTEVIRPSQDWLCSFGAEATTTLNAQNAIWGDIAQGAYGADTISFRRRAKRRWGQKKPGVRSQLLQMLQV